MNDSVKEELHQALWHARGGVLRKVEGLDEYSLRRPVTPTGTNLLGVVKHLGSQEYGYLGEVFGRPPREAAPVGVVWLHDSTDWHAETAGNPDMWARADESSEYLIGFYRRACAHADETILGLDWDTPGFVPWWGEKGSSTTLRTIVIRVLSETLRHAGQLDIVRELVDGRIGAEAGQQGDERWWREYVARVQAAADQFAR